MRKVYLPEDCAFLLALGQTIRKHRLAKGLSQQSLAELCGVHAAYYSDLECGKRNITILNVLHIANALGTTIHELCAEVLADGEEA